MRCNHQRTPHHRRFAARQLSASQVSMLKHQIFSAGEWRRTSGPMMPTMTGPPMEIHIDESATPLACHTAALIPIHWQDKVHQDILRDEALRVTDVCLMANPATWCHRMVVTRKHDGSPRRNVDLSPLNRYCKRETFAAISPCSADSSEHIGHAFRQSSYGMAVYSQNW